MQDLNDQTHSDIIYVLTCQVSLRGLCETKSKDIKVFHSEILENSVVSLNDKRNNNEENRIPIDVSGHLSSPNFPVHTQKIN